MGNYYQGGLAVQSGDTVYYGFRDDRKADSGECYGLIARKTDGKHENSFHFEPCTDSLYLGEDGAFYLSVLGKAAPLRPPAADKLRGRSTPQRARSTHSRSMTAGSMCWKITRRLQLFGSMALPLRLRGKRAVQKSDGRHYVQSGNQHGPFPYFSTTRRISSLGTARSLPAAEAAMFSTTMRSGRLTLRPARRAVRWISTTLI